jgi:hypothetical protein
MGKRKEKRRISLYRRKGHRSLSVSFLRPPDTSLLYRRQVSISISLSLPATAAPLSLPATAASLSLSLSLYLRCGRQPADGDRCPTASTAPMPAPTMADPMDPAPLATHPVAWRLDCARVTWPPHLPPPAWPRGGHDEVEGGVLGLHSPPPVQQLCPPPQVHERAPRRLSQPGYEKADDRRGERRVREAHR